VGELWHFLIYIRRLEDKTLQAGGQQEASDFQKLSLDQLSAEGSTGWSRGAGD
jgi:hypothetical protein